MGLLAPCPGLHAKACMMYPCFVDHLTDSLHPHHQTDSNCSLGLRGTAMCSSLPLRRRPLEKRGRKPNIYPGTAITLSLEAVVYCTDIHRAIVNPMFFQSLLLSCLPLTPRTPRSPSRFERTCQKDRCELTDCLTASS